MTDLEAGGDHPGRQSAVRKAPYQPPWVWPVMTDMMMLAERHAMGELSGTVKVLADETESN